MMVTQSRYDPAVESREVHATVPTNQSWSPEQLCILNDFAWWLEEWKDSLRPTGPRMVIEAVAGSGKTTILKAMLSIVTQICPFQKVMASAFNKHISQELKREVEDAKRKGLVGAEILGSSNTINAGGYALLKMACEERGMSLKMEGGIPKYRVLCRQVWAEFLGTLGKALDYQGGREWYIVNAIADELEMPRSPRKVWYRVARDLEALVSVLQDVGFNPSEDEDKDISQIMDIARENMETRGLEDSSIWAFPYTSNAFQMARQVLIRGRDHAFECEISIEDLDDAVVPRPTWDKPDGNFIEGGRYDTGLYPLRRWGSKKDILADTTQLLWPVRKPGPLDATMSFSDQIWLPTVLDLKLNRYQIAFIDEIQDLSVTKGNLYRSLLVDDGSETVVLVGDTRQSIMGWSGASKESVRLNAYISDCISYPMTYSWRSSYAVAESARGIMQEATAFAQSLWPNHEFPPFQDHQAPSFNSARWPQGEEEITIYEDELALHIESLRATTRSHKIAIVSRLKAPLGMVAIELVKRGIPISTSDSAEILDSIKWVLKNEYKPPKHKNEKKGISFEWDGSWPDQYWSGKRSITYRFRMLKLWCQEQAIERAGGDKRVAEMEDRYVKEQDDILLAESLVTLYEKNFEDVLGYTMDYSLSHFNKWVKDELFGDSQNPVHLTSVHRYKGAESHYTYLLESMRMKDDPDREKESRNIFLLDHMMHKSPQTAQEEMCILYVAATRAKIQNIRVRAIE